MTGLFTRAQNMHILKKDKQVEEALSSLVRDKVIHAVGVTPQAAEDMLSGIAGAGQCPACSQGHPLLLGLRQPFQLMLTASQARKEGQQASPMFRQARAHLLKIRAVRWAATRMS